VRALLGALLLTAVLAGCGGASGPHADLDVAFSGNGAPVIYGLRCPGATMCSTLAAHHDRYFGAHDAGWCAPVMAGYSPSIHLRIDGTWDGRAVSERYSCSQAALTRWAALLGYRIVTGRVFTTTTTP
jgi:hypothetical protein